MNNKKTHKKHRKTRRRHRKTRRTRNHAKKGGGKMKKHLLQDIELHKTNEINGNSIYQTYLDGCYYHFYNNKQLAYLLFIRNDNYYIMKFNGEPFNDDDVTVTNESDTILQSNDNIVIKRSKLKKLNVLLVNGNNICHKEADLSKAKQKISQLNTLLKQKCNGLDLQIDYLYNMHPPQNKLVSHGNGNNPYSLILCLFNDSGCISSIEITIDDNVMLINSKTEREYENNRYNKLLRCVVIIISPLLVMGEDIIVRSLAINPISAYLLIKYFGGTVPDIDDNKVLLSFFKDNNISVGSSMELDSLMRYTASEFMLVVDILVNETNSQNAIIMFNKTVNELRCVEE